MTDPMLALVLIRQQELRDEAARAHRAACLAPPRPPSRLAGLRDRFAVRREPAPCPTC